MKRLGSAVLSYMAFATVAHAACSTASMAGKWTLVGQGQVCTATVATSGAFTTVCSAPPNFTGTLVVTSACRVSGTASGIAFKGRTEAIPVGSTLKPTLIIGASTNGQIAFTGFRQ